MKNKIKKIRIPCRFVSIASTMVLLAALGVMAIGYIKEERVYFGFGFAFMIGALLIYALLPAYCYTADEGFVIDMPFRPARVIPYDEIEWVSHDLKYAGRSSNSRSVGVSGILIDYCISIFTEKETFSFNMRLPYSGSKAMVYDPTMREMLLMSSPYAELEKSIKEAKGMDTTPAYVKRAMERIQGVRDSKGRLTGRAAR